MGSVPFHPRVYSMENWAPWSQMLEHIRDAYAQEKTLFTWQRGDILLLDNVLLAHGRSPFAGTRKIVVAMA